MVRLFAPSFVGVQPRRHPTRPRRRVDRVGGPGARVAGLRDHRRGPTRGRPVRRGAGPRALRADRVVASPGRLPMSATAALSIGVVATVSSDRTTSWRSPRARPGDRARAIAAGLLRLGFLASFISEPVLKGFIIGLALTILMGQLPAMFGIDKGSGSFFEKAWDLLTHLDETEALTLGVGVASFVLLMALRRLVPLLPASLVVALAGIAVAAVFDLDDHGLEVIGHIDSGLPDLGLPDLSGVSVHRSARRRGRGHARRLRRGSRRRQDVRRQGGLRRRRQP